MTAVPDSSKPLIAVDIGNARLKLGSFGPAEDCGLPEPDQTLLLTGMRPELDRLAVWLDTVGHGGPGTRFCWWIGSVNRPSATRLVEWLRDHRPQDSITLLAAGDLPLTVSVERPDMVGIDRLLDAVAANRIRSPGRPAIVVDAGTAITVDLVGADGAFCGGAILPGIAMSARALHEFTDLLPLIDMLDLEELPPAVGTATVAAMQSGLFWGAVGAIRELVQQMAGNAQPQILLTGGAGVAVAELLGPAASHLPHLTLAGIAIAHQGTAG